MFDGKGTWRKSSRCLTVFTVVSRPEYYRLARGFVHEILWFWHMNGADTQLRHYLW